MKEIQIQPCEFEKLINENKIIKIEYNFDIEYGFYILFNNNIKIEVYPQEDRGISFLEFYKIKED